MSETDDSIFMTEDDYREDREEQLRAEITSLRSQLEEARAKAIEEAAQVAADAYTEYWRISNEHEAHWRAWQQSGKVGEMPTISLGPMSDFIASRIRALLSAPTEARTASPAPDKEGRE